MGKGRRGLEIRSGLGNTTEVTEIEGVVVRNADESARGLARECAYLNVNTFSLTQLFCVLLSVVLVISARATLISYACVKHRENEHAPFI